MAEQAQLWAAVAPVVADHDLDLYDLELLGAGAAKVLRITVTREGGADVAEIAATSKDLAPIVDEIVTGRYTLEVTSPGLERELKRPRHFEASIGAQIKAKRVTGEETQRLQGKLIAADESGFTIETHDATLSIPYDQARKVRTIFEWSTENLKKEAR